MRTFFESIARPVLAGMLIGHSLASLAFGLMDLRSIDISVVLGMGLAGVFIFWLNPRRARLEMAKQIHEYILREAAPSEPGGPLVLNATRASNIVLLTGLGKSGDIDWTDL